LLKQIEDGFLNSLAPLVISGLWGQGKTELAHQFSKTFKTSLCWWIRSENEITRLADYGELAKALEANDDNPEKQIATVTTKLANLKEWLIVFDNLPNDSGLYFRTADNRSIALIPEITEFSQKVLITSQSANWRGFTVLRDLKLDWNDSLKILQTAKPFTPDDHSQRLIELLDGNALALQQAASYMANTGVDAGTFLDRIIAYKSTLFTTKPALLISQTETVSSVFALNLDHLLKSCATELFGGSKLAEACKSFLFLSAYLNPDMIDLHLWKINSEILPESLSCIVSSELLFDCVLAQLVSHSLIMRYANPNLISVHRLVQFLLRDLHQDCVEWATVALKLTATCWESCESPSQCQTLLAQAATVTNHFLDSAEIQSKLSEEHYSLLNRLLEQMICHLKNAGLFKEALSLAERALIMLTNKEKSEWSMPRYKITNLTGALCIHTAEFPRAKELLTSLKNSIPSEHPNKTDLVAPVLNNLGELYKELGEFEKSKGCFIEALTIYDQLSAPNALEHASALNNYSTLLSNIGYPEESESLIKRALSILNDSPDATEHIRMSTAQNLAALHVRSGKSEDAIEIYETQLRLLDEMPDDNLSLKASCTGNLSVVYFSTQNYQRAEMFARRSLHLREVLYGQSHPLVAKSWSSLGPIFRAQKKYDEAESALTKALSLNNQIFGAQHPETAYSLNNLGVLLCCIGNYKDAESSLFEALNIRITHFHRTHPELVQTYSSLFNLYKQDCGFSLEYSLQKLVSIQDRLHGVLHQAERIKLVRYYLAQKNASAPQSKLILEQVGTLFEEAAAACTIELHAFLQNSPDINRVIGANDVAILSPNVKVKLVSDHDKPISRYKVLTGAHAGRLLYISNNSIKKLIPDQSN
jgi:tetratricopeptide (TPR) repeat protein